MVLVCNISRPKQKPCRHTKHLYAPFFLHIVVVAVAIRYTTRPHTAPRTHTRANHPARQHASEQSKDIAITKYVLNTKYVYAYNQYTRDCSDQVHV